MLFGVHHCLQNEIELKKKKLKQIHNNGIIVNKRFLNVISYYTASFVRFLFFVLFDRQFRFVQITKTNK